MNHFFDDIINKLGEPKWYDVNGYPRYCDFAPDEISNIYASIVFLVRIACQGCPKEFDVAVSFNFYSLYGIKWVEERFAAIKKKKKLKEYTLDDVLIPFLNGLKKDDWCNLVHYGDPPNHCEGSGDSMNVYDLRIKECWIRKSIDWKRYKKYEVEIEESPWVTNE